jgi:hypothetical protein
LVRFSFFVAITKKENEQETFLHSHQNVGNEAHIEVHYTSGETVKELVIDLEVEALAPPKSVIF